MKTWLALTGFCVALMCAAFIAGGLSDSNPDRSRAERLSGQEVTSMCDGVGIPHYMTCEEFRALND